MNPRRWAILWTCGLLAALWLMVSLMLVKPKGGRQDAIDRAETAYSR